ncbi:MAG: diguanylate cyclase, partial [Clostridia bacterium]|nr:diguanylate cyclase [Clostridia bacterium]
WYQIQYKDLRNQHDQYLGSLLVFNDITQEHELMENLEYSAIHEQLTGLYNTSYYNQQMKEFEKDENMPLAIALWNINGLKMMNDFYGNERANQAVKVVAKCIKRGLHEGDIAIRMYGDETMVIMKNTFEKEAVSRMNKISRWIHSNKDAGFYISAEFGVAVKMIATDSIEECLTSARNTMYQKKMLNQDSVRSSILNSLKSSLRESDFETEQHAERTSTMAIELGKRLGLDDRELGELSLVSVLHDIGKLSIPDNILQKAQKLDDEEWEIMKNHTIKGYELAKISPELEGIADAILHHHEKWDGTGYPSGLREEEIPLNSRIITVVDSFDVMTHDRPYHTAITVKQAKEKLIQCAGTQFDPMIVKTFLQMLESQNKLSIGG